MRLIVSALSLLMLRVLADNADRTLSFNYFAFFADRFYGRSYFHNYLHLKPDEGASPAGSKSFFVQNGSVHRKPRRNSIASLFGKCKHDFFENKLIYHAR